MEFIIFLGLLRGFTKLLGAQKIKNLPYGAAIAQSRCTPEIPLKQIMNRKFAMSSTKCSPRLLQLIEVRNYSQLVHSLQHNSFN